MKIVINVVKVICVLFLTIGIITFGLKLILSSTILNEEYIFEKLEKTDYYINTYMQVNEDFENYIYQSGLDKNVLNDIITIEDIKKDTQIIITNIYNGTDEQIDITKIEKKLNDNISKSLEEQKISLISQESIDGFIEKISNQYKESILSTKYEKEINNIIKQIKTRIKILSSLSITIIIITIIINIFTGGKKLWKIIGISVFSTGIEYIILNVFIRINIDIKNIIILNNSMSYSLQTIIFDVLNLINIVGIISIVIGFVLIIFGNIINNKNNKNNKTT